CWPLCYTLYASRIFIAMVFHLILIAAPIALLALFLAVVAVEGRTGRRLALSGPRHRFDMKMERTAFIIRHVDWGAFLHDLTKSGAERLLHDVAHTTLLFVRAVERELTSLVRTLRSRREPAALPAPDAEEPSRIAAATAYLKKTVRRSRKVPVVRDTQAP
ncbi:MAG TPA: hypothetical protein VN086_01195, partial [Candidatus Paceibacterota bacterium]|nr:hypothetical protein [Candidatus Paceibacterota bacterium]